MTKPNALIDRIWPIADLLRHDYKRSEYGKVILPFTVLRRLDCVLEPTKTAVVKAAAEVADKNERAAEMFLNKVADQKFHNKSKFSFANLLNDPDQVGANLAHYINGFSANIREILEYFAFAENITRLDKTSPSLLYPVLQEFARIDLHPDVIDNHAMGTVFEELIRRFAEQSNETAGEHFTPREVIKLMVNVLFVEDSDLLRKEGIVKTLYDPACGTGGMLTVAEEYLFQFNDKARLVTFGQEINGESYAICKADVVIKGHEPKNFHFGNSFTSDGLTDEKFDYMLSNPPFGVEWKKVEKQIRDEYEHLGMSGRFGAGLPRISDGSLLFLQHMLSKRKDPANGQGTRIAVVFNGSPLFSGGAGSGESEIRRWILENDWLEAIIGLPDQLFYNTGISTYIWVVTNRKSPERKGKVQLINAATHYKKMPKSLGNKRHRIGDGENGTPQQIQEITRIYGDFTPGPRCKIFDNDDFGYRRITVERPLRLRFALSPDRIRAVLSLTLPVEVRRRAWAALVHGARTPAATAYGFEDNVGLENLFTVKVEPAVGHEPDKEKKKREDAEREQAAQRKRDAFWTALTETVDTVALADAGTFTEKTKFRVMLLARYVAAGVTPPNAKQMQTILETLGERDENAEIFTAADDTTPVPDSQLRDFENVPLKEDIYDYFAREVTPHVPDAWINEDVRDEKDGGVGKVGYEIPFTRHFYEYRPLREIGAIESEIEILEAKIQGMLKNEVLA